MDNKTFTYSYSANQQEEINEIRRKYVAQENNKMDELRKLDRGVTRKAQALSLTYGIFGMLIFGFGMCCVLEWTQLFALGVVGGVLGLAMLTTAHALYNKIIKKERERIAPLIIKLTDELTQQQSTN